MKYIGAHLSISKGIQTIQKQMDILKCETCSLFVKNQKRFESKPMDSKDVQEFRKLVKNPAVIIPHGSYLINLANPETTEKSIDCLVDDLKRCNELGLSLYNLHPGSDVKKMGKKALELIATNINKVHTLVEHVVICIENMAGGGNVCGRTFEELKYIIDRIEDKSRIGVTLDTAHLFGGGYDIRTAESFEKVMKSFDGIVGLKYLKAMHLNDSKCGLDSRKDRHECIGKGHIGLDAFKYIMNSQYFENIPLILETPQPELYKDEIILLKSLIN